MAEANTPEPSIEDILASIRKIISDDDADEPAQAQPVQQPLSTDLDAWNMTEEDEVLDLTEIAEEPPKVGPQPAPLVSNVTVLPQVTAMPKNPPRELDDSSILSDQAMAAASGAFAKLTHVDELPIDSGSGGKTVEDIARELLRPMLRQWIDQNLPPIVERLVERELRKISRKAEDL